jgi:CheY-like chemotaxis protein
MGSTARILVVEHESHARDALSELLRDEGYDVASARSGADARTRLAEFHPDLVLSDEMTRDSGATESSRATDAPALVLMGDDAPRTPARFVRKPIALRELLETVARALAERVSQR